MIVKKKIIQQPYDLEAEKLYYKEAATCPNCGTSRETPYNAPFELPPIEKFDVPYSRSIVYLCRKCGCRWIVKPFKKKRLKKGKQ